MDYDSFCLFSALRVTSFHFRYVSNGRLAGSLQDWHCLAARDGKSFIDDGYGGDEYLLPRERSKGASCVELPAVFVSLARPCKSYSRIYSLVPLLT